MLDMKFVRENPELVRENIKKKFQDAKLPLVDEVLELDEKKRAAITEASELRAQRNTLSKQVGMLMGQAKKDPSKLEEAEAIKAKVKAQAERLAELEKLEVEYEEKLHQDMLQIPNIMKHPQILIAPTLASAILGPISTAVLGMTNTKVGAGMGTSGFVGQFGAFEAMGFTPKSVIEVLLMHFILPALLTLLFDLILRKMKWVKPGYMTL